MKTQIRLNNYQWTVRGNVHVCGYCYDRQGHLLKGISLCNFFAAVNSEAAFKELLLNANGFFSVVIEAQEFLFAAVDRMCRFPLFYTEEMMSDDPNLLSSSGEWDPLAKSFYEASGAVLPGHTLIKDIHQLPAAHYFMRSSSQCLVSPYTTYLTRKEDVRAVTTAELDEIMLSVFSRFIGSLHGRQVIVPLTAGNDSRLILCMLRRMEYKNVLCYTVVGDTDDEWNRAHEAALYLGYPHYRIDMDDERVRQLCYAQSDDFKHYYQFVGALTNFCWLYDYVAIRYLEKHHLIASDAIFAPGHSGDMIGGSHLTKASVQENTSLMGLVRRMYYVSFEYKKNRETRDWLLCYFDDQLRAGYPSYSIYQNWIVQHRQSYNIVHSTRVYDYCGYEVRLPLWDNALYDLFSHLPYEQLQNSRLYIEYVRSVFSLYSLKANAANQSVSWKVTALRVFVKEHMPKSCMKYFHKKNDPIGEEKLSVPLGEELSKWLGYSHTCTNSNELMLQWYLMKIHQYLLHSRSF